MVIEDFSTRLLAFTVALAPAVPISLCLIGFGRARINFITSALGAGALAILAGLVGGVVTAGLKPVEPAWLQATLTAFLAAAIPEEIARYTAVRTIVSQHDDAEVGLDLILGSAWVALGFGIFEKIFYVLDNQDWAAVGMIRAVLAVPSHVIDGIIMGCCLAMGARNPRMVAQWRFAACAVPVVLHGFYDTFAFLLDQTGIWHGFAVESLAKAGLALVIIMEGALLATSAVHVIRYAGMVRLFPTAQPEAPPAADRPTARWARRAAQAMFLAAAVLLTLFGVAVGLSEAGMLLIALPLSLGFLLFAWRMKDLRPRSTHHATAMPHRILELPRTATAAAPDFAKAA